MIDWELVKHALLCAPICAPVCLGLEQLGKLIYRKIKKHYDKEIPR